MSEQAENWLPVPNWEGFYEVSDLGRCRRMAPRGRGKGFGVGLILKPLPARGGYFRYTLGSGDRREQWMAHRLVAMAFIGAPSSPDHQVNHIDGVKANNTVANLEWVTCGENHRHAYATGLRSGNHGGLPGAQNPRAKLSESEVFAIRELRGKFTQAVIAKMFGVSQSHVGNIHARRTWH